MRAALLLLPLLTMLAACSSEKPGLDVAVGFKRLCGPAGASISPYLEAEAPLLELLGGEEGYVGESHVASCQLSQTVVGRTRLALDVTKYSPTVHVEVDTTPLGLSITEACYGVRICDDRDRNGTCSADEPKLGYDAPQSVGGIATHTMVPARLLVADTFDPATCDEE